MKIKRQIERLEDKDEKTIQQFEDVWNAYDKKVDKLYAFQCYVKAYKKIKHDVLLKAVRKYVLHTPDKKYRANLSTYLNREKWNDEYESKEESVYKSPELKND